MKHIAFWTQPSSVNESISLIKELALAHALAGGPQGAVIADFIGRDCFRELCDFELDYSSMSVGDATHCRQSLAFFKKCRYLPLQGDPRLKAEQKFDYAELRCQQSNELFRLRDHGSLNLELWADTAFRRARQKISRVLGKLPRIEDLDFKFGPGATTLTKKSDASIVKKLTAGFSCSEDLLPYASRILQEMPEYVALHQLEAVPIDDDNPIRWEIEKIVKMPGQPQVWHMSQRVHVNVEVTPGRVSFVPKDASVHRTVIVEGSLNVLAQGAIGRFMAKRLKLFGIDLSDQSRNQELARLGSIDGSLATIDLVSASDMMSIGIVRELLDIEWYEFLRTMRSSIVMMSGREITQEKFSSMGNGFTFPLQSLIFWALASSLCTVGEVVSVYGDDIIVPSHRAVEVMRLLSIAGFEPNLKKSFHQGPFRESCGADYLRGSNIRPYYHKEVMSPAELFRLHNFYVRHSMLDFAAKVCELINPSLRIYGPDGFGDGHLLGDFPKRAHKRAQSHGYGGVLFDTFKLLGKRDHTRHQRGFRVLPVYSIYVRENSDAVIPDAAPLLEGATGAEHSASAEQLAIVLNRMKKYQSYIAVEPIPEGDCPLTGGTYKLCSVPGTDGYRKVSIYTFDIR